MQKAINENKEETLLGKAFIEIKIKNIDEVKNQISDLKCDCLELYEALTKIKFLFEQVK